MQTLNSSDFLRRGQGYGTTNRNFSPNYARCIDFGDNPVVDVNLDNQFNVSRRCLSSDHDFERREVCAHPKINGSISSMKTTRGGAYVTRVVLLTTVRPRFRSFIR